MASDLGVSFMFGLTSAYLRQSGKLTDWKARQLHLLLLPRAMSGDTRAAFAPCAGMFFHTREEFSVGRLTSYAMVWWYYACIMLAIPMVCPNPVGSWEVQVSGFFKYWMVGVDLSPCSELSHRHFLPRARVWPGLHLDSAGAEQYSVPIAHEEPIP